MLHRLVAVLLLLGLVAVGSACSAATAPAVRVQIGRLDVSVTVASTVEQRALGLSGRATLPQDDGMLFVFPESRQPAFWMKGMRFPLDFVWISAALRVVDLTERVSPPGSGTTDSGLPLYRPAEPVLYVLEVNAGAIAASGVRVGDTVIFEPPPPTAGVQ